MMTAWTITLLSAVGLPVVFGLWNLFLSREKTEAMGYKCGVAISKLFNQKLGKKSGERLEDKFQTSLADFMTGMMKGLDSDD